MSVVDRFKSEGLLISPRVVGSFNYDFDSFVKFIKDHQPGVSVIDEGVISAFNNFINGSFASNVKLVSNYDLINESRALPEWIGYYSKRYDFLSSVLSKRSDLKPVVSISRVDKLIGRDDFGLIGLVNGVRETGNGNFVLSLEDLTGSVDLLISKSSSSFGLITELVNDEVIGVNVRKNGKWCFVDDIIFPDIPIHEVKSCKDDSCAVFISDSHVGSNNFLSEPFQKFFDWLNSGDSLASRVKYLFFVGDLVDGVGVYPEQENELNIKDIFLQYQEFAKYLRQVPKDVKVIVSPGNHDACRLSLPQPPLLNDFSRSLKLPNVSFVSNPSTVNIHSNAGFNGYDVLLYHGNSFDYYIGSVPRVRSAGYYKPEVVMEFLLKKRHLSPSHGAAMVAPSVSNDFLLINKVPDVFVSGHVHQSCVSNYKGVSLINSSCFQGQSAFMKRLGMVPNPGKVPVMDLSSRKVSIIDFMK